ncbi:hypothetical protein CTH30272_03870 [Allocatenococcus thiocycli]|nr:hypothetical protein CTH30272_03870 [Catenococcus thiocycli]
MLRDHLAERSIKRQLCDGLNAHIAKERTMSLSLVMFRG